MFFFAHREHLGSSMPHFRFPFTHSLHDLRFEAVAMLSQNWSGLPRAVEMLHQLTQNVSSKDNRILIF